MLEKSYLNDFSNSLKEMIAKDKGKILFGKPIHSIIASGDLIKEGICKQLSECESLINKLSLPEDELIEEKEQLDKAEHKLNKKIEALGDNLNSVLDNIIRKGGNEIEDAADTSCKAMRQIVNNWGVFGGSANNILPQLEGEQDKLVTRTLKRIVEHLNDQIKDKIGYEVKDFLDEVEGIFDRFVKDIDATDMVRSVERNIKLDADENMFIRTEGGQAEASQSTLGFVSELIDSLIQGYTLGLSEVANDIFNHNDTKVKLLNLINSIQRDFDPKPFLEPIRSNKDVIIDLVKKTFIEQTIDPLQKQIEDVQSTITDKTAALETETIKLETIKNKKLQIDNQIDEITQMAGLLEYK